MVRLLSVFVKVTKVPKILREEGPKGIYLRIWYKMFNNKYQRLFQKTYQLWYEKNKLTSQDLALLRKKALQFRKQPLISIITPVYNTNHQHLEECIQSVLNQVYENWELILVDDHSTDTAIRPLLERYAQQDSRIRVLFSTQNQHISAASNHAAQHAKGQFIALLDHDDVLWPHALYKVVEVINNKPKAAFIYSDEDKIAEDGFTHCDPFFKPDWSPHFLWSCNYITHFAVMKLSLFRKVGGFRLGTEGAQDWDLFLRVVEELKGYEQHPWDEYCPIQHVSTILYSWRKSPSSTASEKHAVQAKDYAYTAQIRVLSDMLKRQGGGQVAKTWYIGIHACYPKRRKKPKVSIIIPSKNNLSYLEPCLQSIRTSTYRNYEIVLVDTGSHPETVQKSKGLLTNKDLFLEWKEAFNFSAVCNWAAQQATGEYLLFLNDDTQVLTPDWMEKMLSFAQREEVGAVGAFLLYPHGVLQHAGLVMGKENNQALGKRGFVSNYFRLADLNRDYGMAALYLVNLRDHAAVTAACLLISKKKHEALNGFDESLVVAFNDVDYCLRLLQNGLYNVVLPQVQLIHNESASFGKPGEKKRDLKLFIKEMNYMKKRWKQRLQRDAFFNDHLTLLHALPVVKSEFIETKR